MSIWQHDDATPRHMLLLSACAVLLSLRRKLLRLAFLRFFQAVVLSACRSRASPCSSASCHARTHVRPLTTSTQADSAAAALYCRTLLLLAAAAPRSKKASSPSSELSYLSASLPTMRVTTKSTRRVIGHEQPSDQSGPFILHWPQIFGAAMCHGSLGELTTSASPCPLVVITCTSTQSALLAI